MQKKVNCEFAYAKALEDISEMKLPSLETT